MSRAASLQRRLSIGLAIGITVIWLAGTLAAGLIIRHELDEAFDSALQETAQRLLPLAILDIVDRDAPTPQAHRVAAIGEHEEYLTYLVRDASGNVLLQSHDADPAVYPGVPAHGFRDTPTHRLYGEAAVSGTIYIEIAEPLAHRREAAFEATIGLIAPLPILIPLSLLGIWWFVRRSMRAVLAFSTEIEIRGEGNLSPLSSVQLPAEIAPIAEAVSRLMERLRRALEAERSFAANSAHELRTPIAAALAQTQRLIVEAPEWTMRDRARQIEASLRQLAHLSEKLLQLARAEGGGQISETPQDLLPVLSHLADEFRQRPEVGGRLQLECNDQPALYSQIDMDAFAILMRNLIENALAHGQSDGTVRIAVSGEGAIRVINTGNSVPFETLARLKERFARGGRAANGSGLGLAIADMIATGAGGRLDLISPAAGREDGFEAAFYPPKSRSVQSSSEGKS
jgi:two-component system OmpR family sensor kinase